jgi:2-hydroxy-6-oxonona-2,4-dienedioate hydrolase
MPLIPSLTWPWTTNRRRVAPQPSNTRLTSLWRVVGGRWMHARVSHSIDATLPAVVLVHGLGVSSRYMAPLGERLAEEVRVFAPDLPGYGRSQKPPRPLDVPQLADALVAWMDAVALPRATLVGNSFGAQIVVDLAARYPDRVDRLILIGPTMDAAARTVFGQFVRWAHSIPLEPPMLILTVMRDVLEFGLLRAAWTLHYAMVDHLEEKLPLVQAPTLAIRGEWDALASQAWIERIAAAAPYGHAMTLPGGGHAVNYDAVEPTAGIIRRFVAGPVVGAPWRSAA